MLTPVYQDYEHAAADDVQTGKQRGCHQARSERLNKRPRGRPSVMPLFREELDRLADEGALQPTLARQVRALLKWFQSDYPEHPRIPKVNTLRRKLGSPYNLTVSQISETQ